MTAAQTTAANYRAHDTATDWAGPPRTTIDAAQHDADDHNGGCRKQGGYGRAIVVMDDGEGRCTDLSGRYVWPTYGRSCGAVRF